MHALMQLETFQVLAWSYLRPDPLDDGVDFGPGHRYRALTPPGMRLAQASGFRVDDVSKASHAAVKVMRC